MTKAAAFLLGDASEDEILASFMHEILNIGATSLGDDGLSNLCVTVASSWL
jgi:hypothetical protein